MPEPAEPAPLALLAVPGMQLHLEPIAQQAGYAAVVRTSVPNPSVWSYNQSLSVLQLVTTPAAGAPAQSLRNYERVSLPAGGTATVRFGLTAHDLAFAKQGGAISAVAGDWRVQVGDAEPVAVRVEE